MEAIKCSSNLSTASNNLYPTSLDSVPAPILSISNLDLSLSVAFSSHSAVSASTSSLAFPSLDKAANSLI
jgi:hypothetical protein